MSVTIRRTTKRRHPAENAKAAHAARGATSRKVVVDFPEPLFRETQRAAADLSTNRSSLVRAAVEHYLEGLRRKKLEEELAAGYAANSAMDRGIADEFAAVDYETF
jgi:metal-responsive CopG/Arc/MetJ family transcriptional regulator